MESHVVYVDLPDLPDVYGLSVNGILYVNLSAVAENSESPQSLAR